MKKEDPHKGLPIKNPTQTVSNSMREMYCFTLFLNECLYRGVCREKAFQLYKRIHEHDERMFHLPKEMAMLWKFWVDGYFSIADKMRKDK